MRFFKGGSSGTASTDFWSWWSEGRDRVAQAIRTGGFDQALIVEINQAVGTIDPAMAWELEPGQTAQHAFCISPEGDATLRQVALRWMESAPPADATWEYHASKQRSATMRDLEIAGRRFELAEMRSIAAWDATRRRVDVRLWHPRFGESPAEVNVQAGFIFLDSLLGEDDVERWIGSIDLLEAPTGGRTPAELMAEVDRRKGEPTTGDTWVLAERTDAAGRPEFVLTDASIKRIDHPFSDYHVTIATVLGGLDRLPDEAEIGLLDAEEGDLLPRLVGIATYLARTTTFGVRTMHFVAEDPDAMRPAIDAWAVGLPETMIDGRLQRRLKVNFDHDMAWSFQRELGVR